MLSDSDVADYRRNGFLSGLRLLSARDADMFRQRYESSSAGRRTLSSLGARHRAGDKFEIRDLRPHLYYKWAADLMRSPGLVRAVSTILGPDLLVWETQIFAKPARSEAYISWHQDLTYFGLDSGDEELTAWVALSPSTPESGCMRVMPGSHRQEIVEHRETISKDNLLSRGQEVVVDVDEAMAVDLVLQPGEMSLHHGKIFHASRPNLSDEARIGFAVRCIPTRARPLQGRQYATRLSGKDDYGHFDLLAPAEDDCPSDEKIVEIVQKLNL